MKISVIIPTYDRLDALMLCLKSLIQQSLSKDDYEIIIIDDGSSEIIEYDIDKILINSGIKYFYAKQENKGPAAARNLGIKKAGNNIILFIGDDIILDRNFLLEHYNFHISSPKNCMAMLGFTTWSKEIKISAFMKWLESGGIQFGYDNLEDGSEAGYKYFYTSNISLKKYFLIQNGFFSDSFPYAAFEDIELGYRLEKIGLKLIYNKKARAYHFHEVDYNQFLFRMEKVGYSAGVFANLHPELKPELSLSNDKTSILKNIIKIIIYPLGKMLRINKIAGPYWRLQMLKAYLKGYKKYAS